MNELLLIGSIFIIFGAELLFFKLFAKSGLYVFTAIATIAANIEVLIFIKAFGVDMTLGNVLFAATFLCTDIISEVYGKREARKAVTIGIITNITFVVFAQWWLLYTATNPETMTAMHAVFDQVPRVMIASLVVYIVVQYMDVFLYHKWWTLTDKKFGDHKKYLWFRNNASTLVSQFLNTVLFNVFAFYGTVGKKELLSFIFVGYIIFVATSFADTPFVYLARKISEKGKFVMVSDVNAKN
ncbi:MAG: queuosine precursor transporter [Eubacterium sp.]|nr:queuosine precursor transporter [Eubacterium sp.]